MGQNIFTRLRLLAAVLALFTLSAHAVEKITFIQGQDLWLMDADGSNPLNLTNGAVSCQFPALSPDGSLIAFFKPGYSGEVQMMKAEPISATNMPVSIAAIGRPVWHPDGKRIACDGGVEIRLFTVVDANGAIIEEEPSTRPYVVLAQGTEPAFSPDGEHLAFRSGTEIYELTVSVDGVLTPESPANPKVPLTLAVPQPGRQDYRPAYSPDGKKIVFVELQQDENAQNRMVRLATLDIRDANDVLTPESASHPRAGFSNLAAGFSVVGSPSWNPDGTTIVFQACSDDFQTDLNVFSLLASGPEGASNPRVALSTPSSYHPAFRQAVFTPPSLNPATTSFAITPGTTDGEGWKFEATQPAASVTLRVQSTTSPNDVLSWADLPTATMQPQGGGLWSVTSKVPLGHRHFRVVTTSPGFKTERLASPTEYYLTSPAGRIAYLGFVPQHTENMVTIPAYHDIRLMEADGSDVMIYTDKTLDVQRCALSPDGTKLAFPTYDGRLFVMKNEPMSVTNVPVELLAGSGVTADFFSFLAWSPAGQHLAFAGDAINDRHLRVLKVLANDGSITPFDATTNPLIDVGSATLTYPQYSDPAWSPDGRYLAYIDGGVVKALQIIDGTGAITPPGAGNQPVTLTLFDNASGNPHRPARSLTWSPDNRRLAFIEVEFATNGDYVLRPVMLTARTVTGALKPESVSNPRTVLYPFSFDPYHVESIAWSPDGSTLALGVVESFTIMVGMDVFPTTAFRVATIKPEAVSATNPVTFITPRSNYSGGVVAWGPVFKQSAASLQPPPAPTATTNPATNVSKTSATLNGTVNPSDQQTTVHFEYGPDTNYGTSTANQTLNAGSTNVAVSKAITGLTAGATVHFRVVATNEGGTTNGADEVFTTTLSFAPTGGTLAISGADPIFANSPLTATFSGWSDPDNNTPLTYQVKIDSGAFSSASTSTTVNFNAPANAGTYTLTGRVSDSLGVFTEVTQQFTVVPPLVPVTRLRLHTTGEGVPGAGANGIPTGATWSDFGVPSVNDAGDIAFLGSWTTPSVGSAVFAKGAAVAVSGQTAVNGDGAALAGVTFASFGAPALSGDGSVAFSAVLAGTGVTKSNRNALFTNAGGTLRLVARTGIAATGTAATDKTAGAPAGVNAGATFKTLLSYAQARDEVNFVAQLLAKNGVKTKDDVGVWSDRPSARALCLREGQVVPTATGSFTVKSIAYLSAVAGSPGQGRFHVDTGANAVSVARVTTVRGFQTIFRKTGATSFSVFVTANQSADSLATTPVAPGAAWETFGAPSYASDGSNLGFLATLAGVPSQTNAGIFTDIGNGTASIALRKGEFAPGTVGATFTSFLDPVIGEPGHFAVQATVSGGGDTTKKNNTGLWWRNGTTLKLLARQTGSAAETGGANFGSFTSLALPAHRGPIFLAQLATPKRGQPNPGNVSVATNEAVWAVDSVGATRLVVREGDDLGGKELASLTLLNSVTGSPGQARSYDQTGRIVFRATYRDGSTGIVRVIVP